MGDYVGPAAHAQIVWNPATPQLPAAPAAIHVLVVVREDPYCPSPAPEDQDVHVSVATVPSELEPEYQKLETMPAAASVTEMVPSKRSALLVAISTLVGPTTGALVGSPTAACTVLASEPGMEMNMKSVPPGVQYTGLVAVHRAFKLARTTSVGEVVG